MEIRSFNPTEMLSFSITFLVLHKENYVEVSQNQAKLQLHNEAKLFMAGNRGARI